MNLAVDKSFVTTSLTAGGVLLVASFALQVVMYTLLDSGALTGETLYFTLVALANFLTWVGALAALPGLVALGVAAARPRQ